MAIPKPGDEAVAIDEEPGAGIPEIERLLGVIVSCKQARDAGGQGHLEQARSGRDPLHLFGREAPEVGDQDPVAPPRPGPHQRPGP